MGQSLGKDTILDPTHVWRFLLDWLKKSVHKLFSPSSPSSEMFFNHHRVKTVQSDLMVIYRFLLHRNSEISFIESWFYSFWTSYQHLPTSDLNSYTSSSSVILQEYRITAWRLINIKFCASARFLLQTGLCRVPTCAIKWQNGTWPLTPDPLHIVHCTQLCWTSHANTLNNTHSPLRYPLFPECPLSLSSFDCIVMNFLYIRWWLLILLLYLLFLRSLFLFSAHFQEGAYYDFLFFHLRNHLSSIRK